jgi:hypothetical protein
VVAMHNSFAIFLTMMLFAVWILVAVIFAAIKIKVKNK